MILNAGVWKDAVADCKTHYSASTNQLEKVCKPVVYSRILTLYCQSSRLYWIASYHNPSPIFQEGLSGNIQ